MFEVTPTDLPDLFAVAFKRRADPRGFFVKTFHAEAFAEAGLPTDWRESYYSLSHRNVLRGFHFQVPPADHHKLVFCVEGRVLDVVLDLRRDSPSYGRCASRELDGAAPSGIMIPKGCGHAFLTLSDTALLVYNVSTVYTPAADRGIAWNGAGFDWPIADPLISDRDASFPSLRAFETPF